MDGSAFALRFIGLPEPDGEITAADLIDVMSGLQRALRAIAGQLVGGKLKGRPPREVRELSVLRLAALSGGSTTLLLRVGEHVPETDPDLAHSSTTLTTRLLDGLESLNHPCPPEWTDKAVRERLADLGDSMKKTGAKSVSFRHLHTARTESETVIHLPEWTRRAWLDVPEPEMSETTFVGILEMVDLNQGRFRLRDMVDNTVELHHVQEVEEVAALIGQQVVASGTEKRRPGSSGQILGATVHPVSLPQEWRLPPAATPPRGSLFAMLPVDDLTTEEIDDYLTELRG